MYVSACVCVGERVVDRDKYYVRVHAHPAESRSRKRARAPHTHLIWEHKFVIHITLRSLDALADVQMARRYAAARWYVTGERIGPDRSEV